LTGSSSPLVFEPLPADDPKVRRPDITRARELLGWHPSISLEEGLTRTIAWFKERSAGAQSAGGSRI
jgi:nucleoside-diphosphate-sugar epimerase